MDFGSKAYAQTQESGSLSAGARLGAVPSDALQGEAGGLTAVGHRMVDAIKNLEVLLSQLEEAEARLNGSRPTDKGSANGTTAQAVPNGTIATLMAGMDEISGRISRAQQFAAMLARSI